MQQQRYPSIPPHPDLRTGELMTAHAHAHPFLPSAAGQRTGRPCAFKALRPRWAACFPLQSSCRRAIPLAPRRCSRWRGSLGGPAGKVGSGRRPPRPSACTRREQRRRLRLRLRRGSRRRGKVARCSLCPRTPCLRPRPRCPNTEAVEAAAAVAAVVGLLSRPRRAPLCQPTQHKCSSLPQRWFTQVPCRHRYRCVAVTNEHPSPLVPSLQ